MKNFWRSLLPLTFVASLLACSENSDNAGGATEGTNAVAQDTIIKTDTILKVDTISTIDTISKIDTVSIIDTIAPADSFAITRKDIAGVIQKGPFVGGSPVTVLELDGSDLHQTGRAFRGKVGDKGNFVVNQLSLHSNYAILEASGYYWNEISGKKSSAPITLNAIADLSDRDYVNINLLTQLEYERIQLLIAEEKLSISDAKKQARSEILKIFYSGDEALNLEDMDIFGSEKGDALLLAASIMILADNSEADLTELLYNIAVDLQDDGKLSNDTLRTSIADRAAFNLDTPRIRQNILNWKFTDSLPDFEKYIEKFWSNEYKLGTCNKDNDGEIKKNGNKISAYRTTQFLCKDNSWKAIYFNPDYAYGTITDKRDGQVYRTTKIGDQVWMAENMKYQPQGAQYLYNCYDDIQANCDKYGILYGLIAALEACPENFHIPSEEEWRTLADFLGGDSIAGPKLRAIGGWDVNRFPSTIEDKDEYGFSALPAGVHYFGGFGAITYFWTNRFGKNAEGELLGAYNIAVGDGDRMEFGGTALTTTKISLRCIMDSAK